MPATISQILNKYEVPVMTRNGNQVNLLKICMEKFVKSHQVNLFLAGFSYLEPQWAVEHVLAWFILEAKCYPRMMIGNATRCSSKHFSKEEII